MGALGWVFIKALAWGYGLLPRFLRRLLEESLGGVLHLFRFRAGVVSTNLELAYPADEDRQRRLFRQAYSHLGRLFLEVLSVLGPFRSLVRRHGVLHGIENWKSGKARGKGVIFLSSHVGNWEIMAASGALAGMDLTIVTKHIKPEWLHRELERSRLRVNVRATYEPRTLRDVLRALKQNQTVGFIMDQYAGPPVGIRVPFFGRPVGTTGAVATLAKRTGATVVPVLNYRHPDGRHITEIQPPLDWIEDENPQLEIAKNTAHYAQIVEQHIRSHPEQWLWTHRRFKGDLSPLLEGEWEHGRARA